MPQNHSLPSTSNAQHGPTQPQAQPESVHGEADGSVYSAVLMRTSDGSYALVQLLVDGHLIPVENAAWASREEAVRAVADFAQGDRNPYRG